MAISVTMTIGSERFGCSNERVAIADSGHYIELPLDRLSEIFNNFRMIVGQNDARAIFFSSLNMVMVR